MIQFGRLGILPLLAIWFGFSIYRLYKTGTAIRVLVHLSICIFLIIIAALSALPKPVPFWLHSVGTLAMHFSGFFGYVCIDELFRNGKKSILRYKELYLVTIVSIIVFGADFLRRDRIVPIIDNEPYIRDWQFLVSEFPHYAIMAYMNIKMLYIHIYTYNENKNIVYKIRRTLMISGYTTAAIMFSVVSLNVLVSFFFHDAYRENLNAIYHIGKPILFMAFVLGFAVPQPILEWLLTPLMWYVDHRTQRQIQALEHLRAVLWSHIPPAIQIPLPDSIPARRARLLIDINDARDVLWSTAPSSFPTITPVVEATYISQYIPPDEPLGTMTPPMPYRGTLEKHLTKVAQRLVMSKDLMHGHSIAS